MNHDDALQEMAVERYLLGELSGAALDKFEEHLFECQECAADVNAGAMFIDGAREQLRSPEMAAAPEKAEKAGGWRTWFASPWVLGPALAACMAVIAVQSLVVVPQLKHQVAQAETPAILNNLVLANAGARGDGALPSISAPAHGSFLLSVDVPARNGFASYHCVLYSPSNAVVWQAEVPPQQTNDSLLVHVPVDVTAEGLNTLLIQGSPEGGSAGGKVVELARYKFQLSVSK